MLNSFLNVPELKKNPLPLESVNTVRSTLALAKAGPAGGPGGPGLNPLSNLISRTIRLAHLAAFMHLESKAKAESTTSNLDRGIAVLANLSTLTPYGKLLRGGLVKNAIQVVGKRVIRDRLLLVILDGDGKSGK